jgi:hypothetical protein
MALSTPKAISVWVWAGVGTADETVLALGLGSGLRLSMWPSAVTAGTLAEYEIKA